MRPWALLLLLVACGENVRSPLELADPIAIATAPAGSILHTYTFLCRTELKAPEGDGGYRTIRCFPDLPRGRGTGGPGRVSLGQRRPT